MVSTHTNLTWLWGEEQSWGPYSQTLLSSPLMRTRIQGGHRSPRIKKDLLQLHAFVVCMGYSNRPTAQNNQNARFRTERARKGLTERGKKMMLIKFDASHIKETMSISVPTISLASFIANMLSSEK